MSIPLVLSSSGGMAREATIFYKQLAELVIQLLWASYDVCLLRSVILYV